MNVVRFFEFDGAPPANIDVNFEEFGARAVIFVLSRDDGGELTIVERVREAALDFRILHKDRPSAQTGIVPAKFGFPLVGRELAVSFSGANLQQGRIVFLDEPIRPFGSLTLGYGGTALAALGELTIYTSQNVGIVKYGYIAASGERPFHVRVRQNFSAGVIVRALRPRVSSFRGGTIISDPFPVAPQIEVTAVNDDTVNTNNVQVAFVGILG